MAVKGLWAVDAGRPADHHHGVITARGPLNRELGIESAKEPLEIFLDFSKNHCAVGAERRVIEWIEVLRRWRNEAGVGSRIVPTTFGEVCTLEVEKNGQPRRAERRFMQAQVAGTRRNDVVQQFIRCTVRPFDNI